MTPCLGFWAGYVQRGASRPQISVRYARYVTRHVGGVDTVYEHYICCLSSELTIQCILEKTQHRDATQHVFKLTLEVPIMIRFRIASLVETAS